MATIAGSVGLAPSKAMLAGRDLVKVRDWDRECVRRCPMDEDAVMEDVGGRGLMLCADGEGDSWGSRPLVGTEMDAFLE